MTSLKTLKQCIIQEADKLLPSFQEIASFLHSHPELGNQELQASALLKGILEQHGFHIKPVLPDRFPTAFHAIYGSGSHHIGFLAEYDALPELGHGCGHNLIAAMSTIAAIAAAKVLPSQTATIHLYGCPAEETMGSKVAMAEAGLFHQLEAALIVHPGSDTTFGGTSYATHPLQITFLGKPAHVADPDYHGINALDTLIDFYQQLQQLEKSFSQPYILGKIITEGGTAPNIIPAKAVLKATIRALDVNYLEDHMLPAIKKLAKQVAAAHSAEVQLYHYEPLFMNLINHKPLEALMQSNLRAVGVTDFTITPDDFADGSTDVGNVSHQCPTIQPEIKIGTNIAAHTQEFCAAAASKYGMDMSFKAAKAMALTAADVVYTSS